MSDESSGGCGCFGLVATILVLWAVCFGVTVSGHHYGMRGCSCDRGLEFDR